jgi:competence protein ComFA
MKELWGRKVLLKEMNEEKSVDEVSVKMPAMKEVDAKTVQCLRCGQLHDKKNVELYSERYFCPACIQLGRVDTDQQFYHLPEPEPIARNVCFFWEGELTKGQQVVSDSLVDSVKKAESRMVWAVTGAGKTEMLFKSIHYCLEEGKRVAIASPRVDVCLELFPRIQAVFPKEDVVVLHGAMTETYRYTKLLVCTTHQLLRFFHAFDLLIIDEVDAFPFVGNPLLQYSVEQAVKETSSLFYLTATPTKNLMKKTAQKKLELSILPARYHRRSLPVPKIKWCYHWQQKIAQGKHPRVLTKLIRRLVSTNDLLIFCPSISLMECLETILKEDFPVTPLTCVHSQDPERLEKVINMRKKNYRILLTSTILERGVTFDGVSVIVLGANHPVFTTAALIQIAGRVDRRLVYTAGEVWFLHDGCTQIIKEALQQIKTMNRIGRERGLIDEM